MTGLRTPSTTALTPTRHAHGWPSSSRCATGPPPTPPPDPPQPPPPTSNTSPQPAKAAPAPARAAPPTSAAGTTSKPTAAGKDNATEDAGYRPAPAAAAIKPRLTTTD